MISRGVASLETRTAAAPETLGAAGAADEAKISTSHVSHQRAFGRYGMSRSIGKSFSKEPLL